MKIDMGGKKINECDHGGSSVHWFTSPRNDWEIKWCENCGSLKKFNPDTKEFEWRSPRLRTEFYSKKK
jgi:hypothetical protein